MKWCVKIHETTRLKRIHGRIMEMRWHWESCSVNEVPKTIKTDLSGVQVGPFGPKLSQNDAPERRNIFQALRGPKTIEQK